MGKIASIFGTTLRFAKEHPLAALGLGGFVGQDVVAPLGKALLTDQYAEEGNQIMREMAAQEGAQRQAERLQRDMALNTARLASMHPEIYTQVMAGRRLAPGSVVFGGQPRTDLIERLAMRMATGQTAQE